MESFWYSLSASELAFCKRFAVQVHDSSGLKQLRTLWAAYCIHQNMSIDNLSYDRELLQVWHAIESVPYRYEAEEVKSLQAFSNYMAELVA